MQRRTKLIVGLASLLLVASAAGATYAVVRPSVSGATSDVIRTSGSNISLSGSGGAPGIRTILTVNLPEGRWVISADASIFSPGYFDLFRCGIFKGSTMLNNLGVEAGSAQSAAAVSVSSAITSSKLFTASLKCWHDTDEPGADEAYVQGGTTLWAHKATVLDARTTP